MADKYEGATPAATMRDLVVRWLDAHAKELDVDNDDPYIAYDQTMCEKAASMIRGSDAVYRAAKTLLDADDAVQIGGSTNYKAVFDAWDSLVEAVAKLEDFDGS